MSAARVLVIYKRTTYQRFRGGKSKRIQALLDEGHRSVASLLEAHEAHLATLERTKEVLKQLGASARFRHAYSPEPNDAWDLVVTLGGECRGDRLPNCQKVLRYQLAQAGVVCMEVVFQTAYQGFGYIGGYRCDETEPIGRETGTQDRHGNDPWLALARDFCHQHHHFLITDLFRTGCVIDLARGLVTACHAEQVDQQVLQGNGRRLGSHPARRHHHWQIQCQVPHHLESRRPGSYNYSRPYLRHRYRATAQCIARFAAGYDVFSACVFRHQAAQVYDTLHPGAGCGSGEISGGYQVELAEIPA